MTTATPPPRRTRLLLGPLALVAALTLAALAGCSGDEEPAASATETPSATTSTEATEATEGAPAPAGAGESTDTYTDSPVPTTVEVPVEDLPGFEAVRFWGDEDELIEGPRQVTGGLVVEEGELVVQAASLEDLLSEDTARAHLRWWSRSNSFTEEDAVALDPVVVDGEEMLRARGTNGSQVYDYFVRLDDAGEALSVSFSLPQALSEAEREEYIGSVLSTVEFE